MELMKYTVMFIFSFIMSIIILYMTKNSSSYVYGMALLGAVVSVVSLAGTWLEYFLKNNRMDK